MSEWLEYRLDRLTFPNGRRIVFGGESRMLYNPTDNIIAIETTGEKRRQVRAAVGAGAELRRIDYSMLIDLTSSGESAGGRRRTLTFWHPLKSGTGVRVQFNDRGDLFFLQEQGRPLFSKDFTVRDVSRGEIDSDRAVWQFHGYRHEH